MVRVGVAFTRRISKPTLNLEDKLRYIHGTSLARAFVAVQRGCSVVAAQHRDESACSPLSSAARFLATIRNVPATAELLHDSAAMTEPPLTQVAATLRRITEALAHEVSSPANEPPQWTEFEWCMARAVTAMHGVSSLLHSGLRWEGPASWRNFLHEQQIQSVGRYVQTARLLSEIDMRARNVGVGFVALKGAALYAAGIYQGGERPMGDIDLLIRRDDATAVERVLNHCNYEAAFTTQRHSVYRPQIRKPTTDYILGEHADNPIKIEVHTRIAESLPILVTDITQYSLPGAMRPGLNEYPSAVCLMMHLLLHAAGNMRARALRLIQLHDISRLAARFTPDNWEELFAARPDGVSPWWALAPLILTKRYYPAAIPFDLARVREECPWLLDRFARRQRLTDVSWSNIHIQAFPGVEWSRTPLEAIAFMKSRIWPGREARLELKEGHAQIPHSATVPWYGISHGARILRWIFSRPPRVQTLLSVRAALGQCNNEVGGNTRAHYVEPGVNGRVA